MTKRKTKTFTAKQTCLCSNCEGLVFGLLNDLKEQAIKQKRCGIALDAIGDLEVSLIDGNVSMVKQRDSAWKMGNRKFGRRFHVELK